MLRSSLAVAAASLFVTLPASAGPRTLTVPMPDRADVQPAVQGQRLVYLSFDGVTLTASQTADDARTNTSFVLSAVLPTGQTRAVPPFDPADLTDAFGATRAEIIQYTVDELYSIFEPYNVDFTLTRPAEGDYHMIVFGGTCSSVAGQVCAGIAPLDCGDHGRRNIVFVFPPELSAPELAPTAAQELAHAFGLAHTLDQSDVMYPFTNPTNPPRAFGAGQIPEGDERCNGSLTFQDSAQEMMDIVGFRGQDTTGPVLVLSSPAEGDVIGSDTPVVVQATDQSGVASVSLVIEGALIDTRTAPPYEFSIPADTPPGPLFLTLRAVDELGNNSQLRVSVTLGDGASSELGATCERSEDCGSRVCAELDGEKLCSKTCASDDECPSGFSCRGQTACWPVDDSGGCAAGGRSALGGLGLALAALAWLTTRRRRL